MLAPKGSLAAAEVAFFSPVLCIGIFLLFRHGFTRKLGWVYVVLLSILRLIGGSVTIYMDVNNNYSASLIETAAITSAVGTAPLLLALMGFLERVNQGMESKGLPLLIFRPLHLLSIAGLVLAIVGGVNESDGEATGRTLMKAAALVFLAIYLALVAIDVRTGMMANHILSHERLLARACLLVLPFLLIRVIYTVAASFASPGSVFYFQDVNVYISAFMQFLMEALTVSTFIFAGLYTPKMEKRAVRVGSTDVEEGGKDYEHDTRQVRHGVRSQQQRPEFQQPRTLGDYRPSRLLMSAINGRK
ncbi:hypothetical protein LTR86_001962 [Recurvomyces mirabilis]|nr:hypothetical protein LTR86_001962 [Recurvomyces mirabilis]